MTSITNEFKVGVFVLVGLVIVIGSYMWSFDGVRDDEAAYQAYFTVPSADGLNVGSPVRLAGVEVGAVQSIEISGDRAEIGIKIRDAYKLPVDSEAGLKASGLLGDYFIRVYPGVSDDILPDGGRLTSRALPGDIDTITRNVEDVSDDIAAITKILRELVEDRNNVDHVESSLANVDALSMELRLMAEQNRYDIRAIVESVKRLTEALEGYSADIAADVDDEMERIKHLTDELDRSAENVTSITGKIDRGEGSIGALVNDTETVDAINDTFKGVNRAVGSLLGLRPQFYYTGRFYMGTEPADLNKFPTGNELAWSMSNTIGLKLQAREDFWYLLEFVDHPQGVVNVREVYREATDTFETRWTRDRGFLFTLQIEKRWGPASFRIGVREGGGGLGFTFYTWRDRLQFSADVFSFRLGAYPAVEDSGIPNTRAFVRIQAMPNLYIEAGAEQIVLGALNGYFTGYLGLGFTFRDDMIRGVFASAPAGAL